MDEIVTRSVSESSPSFDEFNDTAEEFDIASNVILKQNATFGGKLSLQKKPTFLRIVAYLFQMPDNTLNLWQRVSSVL